MTNKLGPGAGRECHIHRLSRALSTLSTGDSSLTRRIEDANDLDN